MNACAASATMPAKHRSLEVLYEDRAGGLYREHPTVDGADLTATLSQLLSQETDQGAF